MPPCAHLLDLDCSEHFSRMIVLGWYDGATSGVADCAGCAANYQFDLLAEIPVGDDNLRVFLLESAPHDLLDRAAHVLTPLGRPKWPEWLPSFNAVDRAEGDAVRAALDGLLGEQGQPRFVVAALAIGRRFVASKELIEAEWAAFGGPTNRPKSFLFWARWLGLEGQAESGLWRTEP